MNMPASVGPQSKSARPCLVRQPRGGAQPATQHVDVLRNGARAWNAWRLDNPGVVPVLNDLQVSVTERQFGRVQGGPINLSRAQLRRARLDQATLIEANLMGALLMEAELSDARLEKADLRGARLDYANLGGAQLDGADLSGAHLGLARGLTQAQIDRSRGDHRTALPAHLTLPEAWLNEGHPSGPPRSPRTRPADAGPGNASERLRTIDTAHRETRKLERQESPGHEASGPLRAANIVSATVVMAAIAVGALIAMMETHAEDSGTPAAASSQTSTSAQGDQLQPSLRPTQRSSG
jgi:pentapeptide repeat protein